MTLTEVQYLIIATDEADDAMLQATRRRANLWEYQDSRQLSAFPNDDPRKVGRGVRMVVAARPASASPHFLTILQESRGESKQHGYGSTPRWKAKI